MAPAAWARSIARSDTKLGREVALKVLPRAFANDPDRLARFRREAQVLASLNHPHIGAIYGLEEADGTQALVLELVEGRRSPITDRAGAIPVDEALRIAKQIAEALEAAHEQGIIHRDLKPANIKVRADGTSRCWTSAWRRRWSAAGICGRTSRTSPTITSPAMMTGVGVILGTAAYMSPEQAKGPTGGQARGTSGRSAVCSSKCSPVAARSAVRTLRRRLPT